MIAPLIGGSFNLQFCVANEYPDGWFFGFYTALGISGPTLPVRTYWRNRVTVSPTVTRFAATLRETRNAWARNWTTPKRRAGPLLVFPRRGTPSSSGTRPRPCELPNPPAFNLLKAKIMEHLSRISVLLLNFLLFSQIFFQLESYISFT